MPTPRCADAAAIAEAVRLLNGGGLVALPTETVYGLAARATDGAAVARVFEAKGRPRFNPLIAHIADAAMAREHVVWHARAEDLAARFWPGPLTLVLPKRRDSSVHELVTNGLASLAVRCPAHATAQSVIAGVGAPLAAPSANPSGKLSPTTAQHVEAGLGEAVDLILDAGPCDIGVESTVLDLTGDAPAILRPGGITEAQLRAVLGALQPAEDSATPRSPGRLPAHYAPRALLRLDATEPEPGEAYLSFGPCALDGPRIRHLSREGDLRAAASRLFACLHELDATGVARIAVAPIPTQGLGRAINDRLARAAHR